MDERRGEQRAPGTGPPIPPPKARAAYNAHIGDCRVCKDIDRGRCDKGEALWHAWNDACDDAFRRLAEETR